MSIFIKSSEQKARMDICRSCDHYKEDTRSCGTLIVGDYVNVGKKRRVKLCGCVMPLKTKFKVSSCPLKKWSSDVDKKHLKELKDLYGKIENGRIKTEDAKQLVEAYNKTFGASRQLTSCGSCLRELAKEIEETLKHE